MCFTLISRYKTREKFCLKKYIPNSKYLLTLSTSTYLSYTLFKNVLYIMRPSTRPCVQFNKKLFKKESLTQILIIPIQESSKLLKNCIDFMKAFVIFELLNSTNLRSSTQWRNYLSVRLWNSMHDYRLTHFFYNKNIWCRYKILF